jgi:hypothetical protein
VKSFPSAHFFHIAEPLNLPSIRRHGLLSSERLVAQTTSVESERETILRRHRIGSLVLPNGVIIRDQSPMPPNLLAPALRDGMTPPEWYRFLNGFVFLWANEDRLQRHLRAFEGRGQEVLVFDASRIVQELADRIFLCPINSGNAKRNAVARSRRLFVPYRKWLSDGWPTIERPRPKSSLPAEIALEGHLPLEPYLVEIRKTKEGQVR